MVPPAVIVAGPVLSIEMSGVRRGTSKKSSSHTCCPAGGRAHALTTLWRLASPALVCAVHLYVHRSPGSRVVGEASPCLVSSVGGVALQRESSTTTLCSGTSPGLLTSRVNSTSDPASAEPGPLLSTWICGCEATVTFSFAALHRLFVALLLASPP